MALSRTARPLLTLALLAAGRVAAQDRDAFEGPPIRYSETLPDDAVTRLNRLVAGRADEMRGWDERRRLAWVLDQLGVPAASQLLVFSKTSLQRQDIGPGHPRALFFSDDAYVGWVPGGMMEITVFDPVLGATFYQIDPSARGPLAQRSAECLLCHRAHESAPSLRARSVFPDRQGEPLGGSSAANIEPSTPLEARWGGWYVTGRPGMLRHRGNVTGDTLEALSGAPAGRVLAELPAAANPGLYPRPTSDVVALLVHDHQVHVHNVLLSAALQSRLALHRWPFMREVLRLPADAPPAGSCLVVLDSQARKVTDALLCVGESAFPEDGVGGHGDFEAAYRAGRRPDPLGRSLRDLDLSTRLFRYRCSPLVYAESFRAMPEELRSRVLRRLADGLSAKVAPEGFQHLPDAERRAIREILEATLPGFPAIAAKAGR